jgi:predicted porin
MKKIFAIMIALAATSVFAQGAVNITGLVDTGLLFTNAATGVNTKGLAANNSSTTVLSIAGTDDLGGGLRANFKLQLTPDFINGAGVEGTTYNSTTAGTVGLGQEAFIGTEANWGTVKLGRVNSNILETWLNGSALGTAIGSGYGSNGNIFTRYSATATHTAQSAPTRFNGAIRYESPAVAGFSGSYLYVPPSASVNAQSVVDYGVKYANGPLSVQYASQRIEQSGTLATTTASFITPGSQALEAGTNNTLSLLSANYQIGAATVYGARWTEKQNTATAIDQVGQMFGAKYTVGATSFMISTGSSNEKSTANVDKKILGYGVNHDLSKRTTLYARLDTRDADTNTAGATAAAGVTKRTAVGIRHTF